MKRTIYGITDDNIERATLILSNLSSVNEDFAFDMAEKIFIHEWAHPFNIEIDNDEKNRRFSRYLDRVESLYNAILKTGRVPQLSTSETEAHSFACKLKSEALEFHEEEGTPMEWMSSTRKLGDIGFFDGTIYVALSHIALDDYGVPRWEALKSMGRIGNCAFFPVLERAYNGNFRNPNTPTGHYEHVIMALLCMGEKCPKAFEFLNQHYSEIVDKLSYFHADELKHNLDKTLYEAGVRQ